MSKFAKVTRRPERGPELEVSRLEIRAVRAGDLGRLGMLAAERNGGEPGVHASLFHKELSAVLAGEPRQLLVGVLGEEVVAYARASRFERDASMPGNCAPSGWYLTGIVVAPEHRREGIGRSLTRARLRAIWETTSAVYYFANAANLVTIELHQEFGFREVTRDFWYPGVTFEGGIGVLFRAERPRE